MMFMSFCSASARSVRPAALYAFTLSEHCFTIDCSMSSISVSSMPSEFPFCRAAMSRSFRAARIRRIVADSAVFLARIASCRADLKDWRRLFMFLCLLVKSA